MNRVWKSIQKSLDRSIWFRILLGLIIAYLALLIFDWFELVSSDIDVCEPKLSLNCFTKKLIGILTIDNLESFSLLLVATLYVIESRQRRRQSQYESWQVIDAAVGVETSYARFKALQDLNSDGVSLRGIDMPSVDLEGINLAGADLRDADLRGVSLKGANLRSANLQGANFSKDDDKKTASLENADLTNANLASANIEGVNFTGASLDYINLENTKIDNQTQLPTKQMLVWKIINQSHRIRNLRRADLEKTNLSNADFSGMDLRRASFRGAILKNANLYKAKIIDTDFTNADLSGAKTRKEKSFYIGTRPQTLSSWMRGKINNHSLSERFIERSPRSRKD